MNTPAERFEISVVVPVYNEQENLRTLVDELRSVLEPLGRRYELLLVNDGSRDGSAEILDELARAGIGVRTLHFRENAGQTAAFDAGFHAARGEVVVTLDADLQNDPRDIPKLLEALEGHDAAVGYRTVRRDNLVKRVASRIGNSVRNRLSEDDIIDTGCSLKAFRTECLRKLKLYNGLHRFLPTLLRMEGCDVVQVPVRHRPRTHGESKYGVWDRAFRGLADLLAVRWMKRRRLRYEVERDEP